MSSFIVNHTFTFPFTLIYVDLSKSMKQKSQVGHIAPLLNEVLSWSRYSLKSLEKHDLSEVQFFIYLFLSRFELKGGGGFHYNR